MTRKAQRDAIKRHMSLSPTIPAAPVKMVRFPNDMLTTIAKDMKPATDSKRKSRAKKKFDLTRLPTEILLTIFDHLDVFDSATLALTCKRLANIATIHSQLDMPMEAPRSYFWKPYEERHFLKKRLGDKFFSKRLRYCWGCKHYVPRREGHWKQKLGAKRFGNMLREHKSWDFDQWWKSPNTEQMLKQWNKGNAHKCPRCKLYKAFGLSPS